MKRAFTLAEVLIVLGIMGIVAALTMPSLIANHRKKIVTTRIQKFYTTINQAMDRAEVRHGQVKHWKYPTNAYTPDQIETWWNTYLGPEIKTLKTEKDKSYFYIYFMDGSKVNFFVHNTTAGAAVGSMPAFHIYFFPKASDNATSMGKTHFTFFFSPSTENFIKTYNNGWNGKRETLMTGTYGCAQNTNTKHYCTKLLEWHNWQIPDDYPHRF